MSQLLLARVVLLLLGVAVWGYGYRYDDSSVRLGGIFILVMAMLLRFLGRKRARDDDQSVPPAE